MSLGEGLNSIDSRPHKQQQLPNNIPLVNSSRVYFSPNGFLHSDITLQPTMASCDMSAFPANDADPSNATNGPGPIHVGMGDASNSVKLGTTDYFESATPMRASAPNFIPDFPTTSPFGAVAHLNHTATFSSSSGTSSISSNPSHVASPVMHATQTNYNGTSSLASAFDNMGDSRSRSGSSASPSNFTGAKSDFSYAPVSAQPSPEFHFPPADMAQDQKGKSSDAPADSHLMAIGGLLANISKTAHSAHESCIMGNGASAGARVDELRRTIALVSDLIAATHLADSPPSNKSPKYSGISSNTSHSPREIGSINVGQEHHPLSLSPYSSHLMSEALGLMDMQGVMDSGDGSRKRCASTVPGDRVIKAMKMEPQDDAPLHINQTTNAIHHHPSTYPSMPPFTPSNPPSAPSSRPSSSAGLPAHHTFNPILQQQPHSFNFPDLDIISPTTSQHPGHSRNSSSTLPHTAGPPFPSPPVARMSWSDGPATFPHRQHQHTTSASTLNNGINLHGLGPSSATIPFTTPGVFGTPPATQLSQPKAGPGLNGVLISPTTSRPLGRLSRSGSMNGSASNPFAFGLPELHAQDPYCLNHTRPPTAISTPQTPVSSPEEEYDYDQAYESDAGDQSQSHSPVAKRGRSGTDSGGRPTTGHHDHHLASQSSVENIGQTSGGHGNEVPLEYRSVVDRIFFEFLESICSNLDATDGKGEPIHQTLMAKKMQRLDESPEFRPFKFRIQAFTNAFLEELARQGYPEEKIPMKKIRNYLWNQPYISRFNEDGKKAKSKGNHIWNINAKKKTEGGWLFSPFHRRLAGTPQGVAYAGLRWNWAPRIWDPQASRSNVPVTYSSPNLPSWLSWKDDQLSGIPPPDAETCDITVEARFTQDGKEELLTQTVHLNIAPMSTLDTSFSASSSRRPSLVGEVANPRRESSESAVAQLAPARPSVRAQTNIAQQPVVSSAHDSQVLQVLNTAAQRVAQEAQSQVISSRTPSEPTPALELLAKQQHVLTVTAQALDQTLDHGATRVDVSSQPSHVLAMASAAQRVVLQAARTVTADRTALNNSMGVLAAQSTVQSQVTVNEVSVATQTAVAQAVGMAGPLSNEVDVLMTASSLLQQQERNTPPAPSPPAAMEPSKIAVCLESRPHVTGEHPGRQAFAISATTSTTTPTSFLPPSLSSVPLKEYAPL